MIPGEEKTVTVRMRHVRFIEKTVAVKLLLPEGWTAQTSDEVIFTVKHSHIAQMTLTFTPGNFSGAYYYLPVEVRLCDRFNPVVVHLPLQNKNSVSHFSDLVDQEFYDGVNRSKSRICRKSDHPA